MSDEQTTETGLEVAVIGLAGRFPGAPDLAAFWTLLKEGTEAITFFSDEELIAAGEDRGLLGHPRFVRARGVLAEADRFDADFFGYSPREAEVMDPQQRVFLECAWAALEDAGYDPATYSGLIGVWGGVAMNTYLLNLLSHPELIAALGPQQIALANDKDFLCTRVSYKLGLEGPAVTVQTACSSSLVAVHAACQALLSGECDMALAGGVSIGFPQVSGYLYQENGILSPDGRCRAFDAEAKGSVAGQGAGLVVLKRLEKAREDGDTIRAVIKGSALNNDGSAKAGFTAPRIDGQARAIRAAHLMAEIEADSISYVEAHGTGTELGDPIEVAALTQAFAASTERRGFCALGSVKPNIGHLDAGAGVAGLIKTVLALENRLLPPTLHFERPNPQIDLDATPFYVSARPAEWVCDGPRRAGVSSFGLGGTNAHVVLEEAPPLPPADPPGRPWQLLLLSARTETALEAATDRWAEHLRQSPGLELADAAWTSQAGRRAFPHRRMLVARGTGEAAEILAGRTPGRLLAAAAQTGEQPAFLLSGLGDHYAGMGRGLYRSEPAFRETIDRCAEILAPELGLDLREVLYPEGEEEAAAPALDFRALVRPRRATGESPLERTELAQPVLFAVEIALARLWESWGVRPQALLGYSLGEYVAACLAGVLPLEEALVLVARRARLIQSLPAGAMLAVPLSETEIAPWLAPGLSLSAVNGPTLSVVSGPPEAVAALERRLAEAGTVCRPLRTTHAFHSSMMEPIAGAFRELLRSFELRPPSLPYLSNVTGTWIRPEEATDPEYWVAHLLRPVRYAQGIEELLRLPARTLLEIGPGQSLGSLAVQLGRGVVDGLAAVPSLRHEHDRQDDQAFAVRGLGELWLHGVEPDWAAFQGEARRRRVPLPTYPFERRRYWIDRQPSGQPQPEPAGKIADPSGWFWVPSWKRTVRPARAASDGRPWLVLLDEHGFGEALVETLRAAGREVVAAQTGDPGALLQELEQAPEKVVHLASLTREGAGPGLAALNAALSRGFYSLLSLVQALGRRRGGETEICVVTHGLCAVESGDPVFPETATLLGAVRTVSREHEHLVCRAIDIDPGEDGIVGRLAAELACRSRDAVVACRGPHRWTETVEPVLLDEQAVTGQGEPLRLRDQGVYWITGGTGGIGLALAEDLARRVRARLVLTSRSAAADPDRLRAIEALGSPVLVLAADAADEAAMRQAARAARERFGRIDGVFHLAGLPGVGLAQVKTASEAAAVLAPKVQGSLVLEAVLREDPPDFLVLFSSLASVLGGIGLFDYCAATAFLDAFAQRERPWPTVAVHWCEWTSASRIEDMFAADPLLREEIRRQREAYGMTFPEGLEALRRAMESGLSRVFVSTRPLPGLLERPQTLADVLREIEKQRSTAGETRPAGGIEEELARLWEELLGVRPASRHDDFFRLGGHSLLGLQLLARLQAAFGVEISLQALFESPTLEALAAAIAAASDGGNERAAEPPEVHPAQPARMGPFPLSFNQQRLWLLEQIGLGGAPYNVWTALRLAGPLSVPVLAAALRDIAQRHEVLRTTFALADGQPVQVVAPEARLSLPVVDLGALPGARREGEARRLAAESAHRLFDLAAGPLVRVTLFRLGSEDSVVLVALHHIVSDGWSLDILTRELGVLYDAFAHGEASPLPPLPLQYADFARWQRDRLRGEVFEEHVRFWREELAGIPAALDLPTDRPRPAVPTSQGDEVPVVVPAALRDELAALGRAEGATTFMGLLAVLQILLFRWSGQRRLNIGTPVAGRNRRDVEGLIGFFANTVVLHADLAGDPSFRELLGRVRRTALRAFDHQDFPFEKLVELLQPGRDASRSPLFQVMLALQNAQRTALELPGLRLLPLDGVRREVAKFELSLDLTDAAELGGVVEYNRDLFDRSTIQRFAGHFERLLRKALAHPEAAVSALDLLDEGERFQLLAEWNDTGEPLPPEPLLHRLIEDQVRRSPQAVAVEIDGAELTYTGLDTWAGRLARRLRGLGVGPDTPVALCVERSLEMMAGLLAVLKAGGAYVPLDPSYPPDRIAHMLSGALAAASPRVLLAHGATAERIAGPAAVLPGLHLVWLDEPETEGVPESRPVRRAEPVAESLAYVIYTSGSTGAPKGAMNTHRAICNRLLWMQAEYGLTADDRVLQKTPLSFDVSVWELFWPLLTGARLVLARPGEHRDPAALAALIAERGVTTVHFVPSMLQAFVEEPGLERCRALRRVIASGEALPGDLPRRLAARSAAGLHNLYGPTEAAVDVTFQACDGLAGGRASVPIGRPIANASIWLQDIVGQPAPVGVPGELLIGGLGLARGYLGRPDLTAERFVPHPWSGRPGERLYRTGDLARRLPGGEIEFLGRLDHQVKVRGIRIELGEIEAALARHPEVREAVVVTRQDLIGGVRLMAFVVPRQDFPGEDELLRFLRERLPEPVVPGRLVGLPELPTLPNGKVDRRALAQLAPEPAASSAGPSKASLTWTEEMLAGIFAEVLGLERAGVDESFFDLGGHSLLATQVASRLRRDLRLDLPLRAIFDAPTPARLARVVDEALRDAQGLRMPPIRPVERDLPLPLSFSQQRLWFLDRMEPDSPHYNIPAPFRLLGRLDPAALAAALGEVVRRHETLRTTFASPPGGDPVQVIAAARPVPLPRVDLRALPDTARSAELGRLSGEEARRPFDLTRGPLLRATLLALRDDEHAILLTVHHIVSDGWSMGVLVDELSTLYAAFSQGRPSPLPELEIQYADFASWQREWMAGEVLDAEVAYWRSRLAGAPALELPTDRPRPSVPTFRGGTVPLAFGSAPAGHLRALARRRSATPFMTLLAAFQALLARSGGQDDLCVGTPIAGRNHLQIEPLIGFFVNTLVLRTDLSGDPSFDEILDRVRDTTLAAQAHQDLPFEKLVERLQPRRHAGASPLFQAMLVLQNAPAGNLEAPGLVFEPVAVDLGVAKFDLTLWLTEDGGALAGGLEFNRDLFDDPTAQRLAEHLRVLLSAALDAPGTPLSELPLLTPWERAQLLLEWNDTARPLPDLCIHEVFAERAALTPDAIALGMAGETLTYRELDRRANGLAWELRRRGAGPEVPVAFCLEKSFDLIVTLLAILKAGSVYVPLDPAHPAERLSLMIEDAGARVVVTSAALALRLPCEGSRLFLLQEGRDVPEADAPPESWTTPDHLAYVMYTSGSTGRPKGAAIIHRGVVRLVLGAEYVDFGPREVVLQFAPVTFDASTLEIWGALLSGGRLEIHPPGVPSVRELAETVERQGITSLWLTAGLFNQVVESALGRLAGVRQLMSGGDVLSPQHARQVLERLPGCRLMNGYGPTENTTFTCCHTVAVEDLALGSLPIGRPVSNTRAYVLDAALRPVPAGVSGELCTGGAGLARGYVGRPDLTAERFVPDPVSGEPGARLYRTGDLVRFRAQGEMEFLGRIDNQVKVRGFRVEPGEIEAVLADHPAALQGAVVPREDSAGGRSLAAFVVPRQPGALTAGALRSFLRDRLPEALVPSTLIFLEALPLNHNGKVDRRALAALAAPLQETDEAGGETGSRPRGPVEDLVAGIFAAVLGLPQVDADDDFFERGGHSLLATRLVARIEEATGVQIPLRTVFENPTVARLASFLESALRSGTGAPLPPVEPQPRHGPLPLSFAQRRLWFVDQAEPGSPAYNIPAALILEGALDPAVLEASLGEVVRRHEVLRTTFAVVEHDPVQVIAPWKPPVLPLADLAGLPAAAREEESRRLARDEAARPFDLRNAPLLRALLVRRDAREALLLVTLHHIAGDGWSMGILVREVAALYQSLSRGEPSPLPELRIQYADFALWQQQVLDAAAQERLLAYWKKRLAGAPPRLELPGARPRPTRSSHRGGERSRRLPESLARELHALTRRESATLFMTLLAAFGAVLHTRTGATDLVVGTDVAGRTRAETEPLIGFFINQLPLRLDLSGDPGFREILARVRETALGAYAHQDLPFERLVEAVAVRTDPHVPPVFQVKLVLQNTPREAVETPDLALRPFPQESLTAQLDLNLRAVEDGGEILLSLEHSAEIYDAALVDRLLEQMEEGLRIAAQAPDTPLAEISRSLQEREKHLKAQEHEELELAGLRKLRRAVAGRR